jgi:hypothetical protein
LSYQIPELVKVMQLRSNGKVGIYRFTPSSDVKLKHIIMTMYIQGLVASDFQMKINVYFDDQGQSTLFQSSVVNNSDITRDPNWYCEQRFDFPTLQNLLVIGHQYFVEFEISGDYGADFDENNYIGLIIDHDSPLAILNEGTNVLRHSAFYEKA